MQTFRPGEIVSGRYRISRFLAAGGMGEIYVARDLPREEWVALKTATCISLDDVRVLERIAVEARLARRVVHRNVCRVFDVGVHQGKAGVRPTESVPFLAMELLTGETLRRRIRREGRLPLVIVASILRPVLAGISAIHAAGIVHRDIKSENILLVPQARGERVVVTDFGLAATVDGRLGIGNDQPMFVGTPATMAPEQRTGAPANPAMDIYALGVLLCELLTGVRPALAPRRAAEDAGEDANEDANEDAAVAMAETIAGRDVRRIIARCLSADPNQRFRDVSELEAALGWSR
ncbi:MAG TPA: serine/threonine-protein kinase [Polyangia bacterium]